MTWPWVLSSKIAGKYFTVGEPEAVEIVGNFHGFVALGGDVN